ncbi:hypothetical protein KUL72_33640 [Bradyrhizobium arachidis]|uniref:hypothetical protein n=1 Tax=Bradyrhizobium TaxID=374 RepID=UPI00188DB311|nr:MULTISPECIES: hypothetical protein [Bradyrhizobium]MDN4983517.1 hypothetical protein [Bradyrhizobium sp. WYCCWR 13022]UVO36166.1 hypothetical protein KUL72_33640 [Bradyrhizobium arachidis]
MDDDVEFDIRRRQDLRLIKAFLSITDARKRRRIIELAERLAEDAELNAAGSAADLAAADATAVEQRKDVPDRIE